MQWKNDWVGFFQVYFKWCYYLCVTPFRIDYDGKTKRFHLSYNWIQRIACALQYVLLGIWYLKDLRKIPVNNKNPVVYFSLAFVLNAIHYHIAVLATSFWRKQHTFLDIVNFDCGANATCSTKSHAFAVLLCFLFALLAFLYSMSGYQVIPTASTWSPSLFFQCLVFEGRVAFFLTSISSNSTCEDNDRPPFSEISPVDICIALISFLMEMARQIFGFYSDFFLIICCLCLWISIKPLRQCFEVEETEAFCCNERKASHECNGNNGKVYPEFSECDGQVGYEKDGSGSVISIMKLVTKKNLTRETCIGIETGNIVLERYERCKAFSRVVNRALGQLLFAYVLSSIMYLSTNMDDVLVLQDWSGKLRVAFFFFIFILMFFLGSEIVSKVYGLRSWLSVPKNNDFLSERNLVVLIHEVTCKSIGITGNGMFTITYSTFMTVMTTTVTFFIIVLQFEKPGRKAE